MLQSGLEEAEQIALEIAKVGNIVSVDLNKTKQPVINNNSQKKVKLMKHKNKKLLKILVISIFF